MFKNIVLRNKLGKWHIFCFSSVGGVVGLAKPNLEHNLGVKNVYKIW